MADQQHPDHDPRPEGAEPEVVPAERLDEPVDPSLDERVGRELDDAVPAPSAPALADETDEQRAEREAEERLLQLFQSTVFGSEGAKVGRVGQVYLDDQTMAPNWVTVKTGLFGTKEYFVPLDEAEFEGKQIRVPYGKETITASPRTEIDQNLSPAEEDDLYNHYRVPGRMTTAEAAPPIPGTEAAPTAPASDPLFDGEAEPAADAEPEPFGDAQAAPYGYGSATPAEPAAADDRAPGFFEGFSGTEAEEGYRDDTAEPISFNFGEAVGDEPRADGSAFAPPADHTGTDTRTDDEGTPRA